MVQPVLSSYFRRIVTLVSLPQKCFLDIFFLIKHPGTMLSFVPLLFFDRIVISWLPLVL